MSPTKHELADLAVLRGDQAAWSTFSLAAGVVLPPDERLVRHMFLINRMRHTGVPVVERQEIRNRLRALGVVEDEPITVIEKLQSLPAKQVFGGDARKILKEYDVCVYVCETENIRTQVFKTVGNQMRSLLDTKRSELYRLVTLNGRELHFVVWDENYKLPLGKQVAYRWMRHV